MAADTTKTQDPAAKEAAPILFDSKNTSTKASSFQVRPGDNSVKSICVIYVPASEPIAAGMTGVLQTVGGQGPSAPVRTMNIELWEEYETPIENKQFDVPPKRFANRFYSMDLMPGANFNVNFELWQRLVKQFPHIQRAMDENFIMVIHPKTTWKGSADHSMAFRDTDASRIMRHTWDKDLLETWKMGENRQSIRAAIDKQLETISKIVRQGRSA